MLIKTNNAFTLIELMLVIIIIGVLGTMAVKNLKGRSGEARMAVARADIETNIAGALDLYELDNGLYPTTDQGLAALIRKPSSAKNWNGPYLKKRRIPKDPWGNPYQFQNPGTNNTDDYDLFSMGKDASPGTEDDISNWDDEDEF
ncbi:type II secretion system major pseudopilin GspG [PVC group bacterium]|nr:type II secretion system major pseudopilin GspG [PVC group bacterium]